MVDFFYLLLPKARGVGGKKETAGVQRSLLFTAVDPTIMAALILPNHPAITGNY
jgi:hypothetical protein